MFLLSFVAISLAASVSVQADGETELVYVPPYSMAVEETVVANVVLKHDLKRTKPESFEHLKIYLAVADLAQAVFNFGEKAYSKLYEEIVYSSIKQVRDNATKANEKLWGLVHKTNKRLVKILSFVIYKQLTVCAKLTNYQCDKLIQRALGKDIFMKIDARLLIAAGEHGKLFVNLSNLFKHIRPLDAEDFLSNAAAVLKPLVLAASKMLGYIENKQV